MRADWKRFDNNHKREEQIADLALIHCSRASKTVIGTDQLASLINGLEPQVRAKLRRCPCRIIFRFGNEGTLTSEQALVVPVGTKILKIAIVKGDTPLLLSKPLMRALEGRIDCHARKLLSPMSWYCIHSFDLYLTSSSAPARVYNATVYDSDTEPTSDMFILMRLSLRSLCMLWKPNGKINWKTGVVALVMLWPYHMATGVLNMACL